MFEFDIDNKEIVERNLDVFKTPYDKEVGKKALVEAMGEDSWIIRPLIFDNNEEGPVSTPILSNLTFKTISDANLEILSHDLFSRDLNKYVRIEAHSNLSSDLTNNVLFSIINSIIETSVLNFNAWWQSVRNKYFPPIENSPGFYSEEAPKKFYEFITNEAGKYYRSLDNSIYAFIRGSLSFNNANCMINKDPDIANIEGLYNHNYKIYLENTAINISNLILIIMVNSITDYLFKRFTLLMSTEHYDPNMEFNNDILSRVMNQSPVLEKNAKNIKGLNNFIHISLEYILEDSLYNLVLTCINPSIMSILQNSINTYFYMYEDLEKYSKEPKKQIENK